MHFIRNSILILVALIFVIPVCLSQFSSPFQQFKTIPKNDPFKLSGYFSTQFLTNTTNSPSPGLDPFNYRLNGNLNIYSYGINTQLSLHYSDGNRVYRFTRPSIELPSFAFFGISPSYKWATLHVGTRSINFSRYTLSGHSFQGAGMDLNPGKWKISGMYGRLRRAQIDDFNALQSLDPSFNRYGWGIKTGYESVNNAIYLIYFSAFDDIPDPGKSLPDFLTPAENSILSLQGKKSIGNHIVIEMDYALSAYTRDRSEVTFTNYNGISILQRMGGLYTPRLSSSFQKALFTKLNIKTKFGFLNLSHERVDPEYRTMGSLFFNNDFENITAGTQFSLNDHKWLINTNIGFQRNNLNNKESNSSKRFIAALQTTMKISESLTINGGFSNYKTTQKLRTNSLPFIETDTIALALVNQSFNLSTTLFTNKDKSNILTTVFQFQKAAAIENDVVIDEQSNANLMAQIMYGHSLNAENDRIYAQFQANKNHGFFSDFLTIVPTLGWRKHFLNKKISASMSASLIYIYSDQMRTNQVFQPRLSILFTPNNHQRLSIETQFLNQKNNALSEPYSQLTSRIEWKLRW